MRSSCLGTTRVPSVLGSGSPHSSLRVLTLTPGRTGALSSPSLRPSSSHQVLRLTETRKSESQDRRSVLFSLQSLPGLMTWAGICGAPAVLPGGVPSVLPQGLTLLPSRASESLLSPTEAPPLIPLSETRMSGSQTTPVVLVLLHGRQGPTTETAFSEVKVPLVPPQGTQLVTPQDLELSSLPT